MLPEAQPISTRPLIEPQWDNRRIDSYFDWLGDNEDKLIQYCIDMARVTGDFTVTDVRGWLPVKWESVRMRTKGVA